MNHLRGVSVLVLGLGESGLAMARWCAGHGASVRVWDSREQAPQDAALAEHVPHAQRLSGALADDALQGVQLVLKSPGLAPTDERIAALLHTARQTGVPVQGELDLFARALADLKDARGYAPKVIAITGTNGKTTTTSMTAQLVERADKRVAVAGNIGPTMLQTLADVLAAEPVPEVVPEAQVSVRPELVEGSVPEEAGLRQAQPERSEGDELGAGEERGAVEEPSAGDSESAEESAEGASEE
ncbi:MAG: UDP-N-acetylmuramoyl-L-alanine--D-glutamate ligase, partial [Rhizobacter sp.]|nr:UDP-N-acetylmuramoyl-L-alanine--D-glutamate ligase [Rhizobacter sp.]